MQAKRTPIVRPHLYGMGTLDTNGLWTKPDLEDAIEHDAVADWKAMRYTSFHETMTDEDAPYLCYFAVEAEQDGRFRYVFPGNPDEPDARSRLADALETYLENYEAIGRVAKSFRIRPGPVDTKW